MFVWYNLYKKNLDVYCSTVRWYYRNTEETLSTYIYILGTKTHTLRLCETRRWACV